MSISEREQQALESIENDLASTGPKLASMLAIFGRLSAGEEMPVRERVRRVFDLPSAARPGVTGTEATGPPGRPRRTLPGLSKQWVWLVWLAAAIALVGWGLTRGNEAAKGACTVPTAACRQMLTPGGPGGPGGPAHGGL